MDIKTQKVINKAFFEGYKEKILEEVIPSPKELKKYMDRFVIGQEYAKKMISTLMINHIYRARYNATVSKSTDMLKKSNMLLIGDSGCGKTLIVRVASEFINVPMVIEDATKLTQEGYVGDSVDTILTSLFLASGKNLEKTEKGIIFLDEFDKLSTSGGARADVSTGAVQQSLLKMVEGGKFHVKTEHGDSHSKKVLVDTSNITFIFAGAFEGMAGKVSSDEETSLGFVKSSREREIIESDIVEFGIMPEILGRIGSYVTLHDLSEAEMLKVLTKVENSIVSQYQKLFEIRGIKWKLTQKQYKEIIKDLKNSKLGARGMQHKIEQLLMEDLFNAK